MLPHALSLGKGFSSSICSHNTHFKMFVWILNDFCGMGYRHMGFMTHHLELPPAVNLTPVVNCVWYYRDILLARTPGNDVSPCVQMAVYLFSTATTTAHYRCYIMTLVLSLWPSQCLNKILWAVVRMFSIHIRKSVMPIQTDFEWQCSFQGKRYFLHN